MAQVVNKRPTVGQELDSFNVPYGGNIYDDTFNDHDEQYIDSKLQSDVSQSMPDAIADNSTTLVTAAKQVFAKRKPIYDWKTTNQSFIDVYNDLKRLGIKNNKFHLILYDRSLQGVDPYTPSLPVDTQIRIYLECVVNPWYFLREIARIPAQGKPIEPGGGDRYRLDRNNLATWYLFLNHIDNYSSKPRQCGKTQDALMKVNWSYHFGSASSSALFFSKDLPLCKENLARLKDQRDLFPSYLQMRAAIDEETGGVVKGIDNIMTMKNPINSNSIKVMPSANSAEMATRLGRGYTAPLEYFDEIDFMNWQVNILMSSSFSYATASENAIRNASAACRLFTSTPGDLSTRDGKAMSDYIKGTKEMRGMFMWNDRCLDQPIDEFKKIVQSTAYNGIVYVEHTWRQLKKSMAWYERQCNLCSYNQEVILREINLQRLAGSSLSPFTREQQLYLAQHIHRPKQEIDIRAKDVMTTLYLYEDLNRKIPYIFGIDPSEGLSADNNALVIINPFTLEVAGEMKTPYFSPKEFSKAIVSLMDRYCPRALLVVEANRGRQLIQYLVESPYQSRVWYDADRMNQLLSEKTDEYGGIPQSVLTRKCQGFITGHKSRNLLFQTLEEMVNEQIDKIFSANVVAELLTLIRKPTTGKIEAAPGEHDDMVMAYLIGLYVYLHASNLHEFGMSRRMRSPDQMGVKERESEADYRSRVAGALNALPDEYRAIFTDYLNERDQVRDARAYAQEIERLRQQDPFAQRPQTSQYDDPDVIPFDQQYQGAPKQGQQPQSGAPQYRPIGYQYQQNANRPADDIFVGDGADMMNFDERANFEKQIFDSNRYRPVQPMPGGSPIDVDPYESFGFASPGSFGSDDDGSGGSLYPDGFDLDDWTDRY